MNSPLIFCGDDWLFSILDNEEKFDTDLCKKEVIPYYLEQLPDKLYQYADKSERDSYGEKVDTLYLVFDKVVNYLSLEEIKSVHLTNKRLDSYASNSDFYRFVVTLCNFGKGNFQSWQQAFLNLMTYNNYFCLKISFCYAFGFPSDFLSPYMKTNDGSIKNDFKRVYYYSGIPSMVHLYSKVVSHENLLKTILDVDEDFIKNESMWYANIRNSCNKEDMLLGPSEKQQFFKNTMNDLFSYYFENVTQKRDELSLKQYYMSLVLALPAIANHTNLFAKLYWYDVLLRFPTVYRNAGFVLLYEQLRKNTTANLSDNIDCQYACLMLSIFQNEYNKTGKFDIFSLRFFANYMNLFNKNV